MDKKTLHKMECLERLCAQDPVCQALTQERQRLQDQLVKLTDRLPPCQQELIWNYIIACDDLQQRILQLSCSL